MSGDKWTTWGATMIGPGHLRLGLPNQDAWIAKHFQWGDVIVVADGLGSKPKSDLGSKAACLAVIDAAKLYHRLPETKIEDLLKLVHLLWTMHIAPNSPDDCATTCLFAIRNDKTIFLAQLGDGMIAASKVGGEMLLLLDSKEDSFSNVTFSLGANHFHERWRTSIAVSQDCDAIILCSDGISDDLLPEKRDDFIRELAQYYKTYSPKDRTMELHRWMKDWPVPGHSDDKTIACLYKFGRIE